MQVGLPGQDGAITEPRMLIIQTFALIEVTFRATRAAAAAPKNAAVISEITAWFAYRSEKRRFDAKMWETHDS